jgi:hypothetical protein
VFIHTISRRAQAARDLTHTFALGQMRDHPDRVERELYMWITIGRNQWCDHTAPQGRASPGFGTATAGTVATAKLRLQRLSKPETTARCANIVPEL